jgi:hypothetical protein
MNGLVLGYLLIEYVRIGDRAVFDAGGAAGTFFLDNVSGFLVQGDGKISRFPSHMVHFRISKNFDVWMPADLDQFGRQDSHGAVIGREGLIQLGHVAPDTRSPLNQVDLKTGCGHVQRGLNPADPAADDHNIANLFACGAFTKLFYLFFFQCFIPSLDFFKSLPV